jgi:hypothetical protein
MIQKIAEKVFPDHKNSPRTVGGYVLNVENILKRNAYTTALDHAFECFEWASAECLSFSQHEKKWHDEFGDTHPCNEMTTPELFDYWFNNIKSKEK